MTRHTEYQRMLACRDAEDPRDRMALARHLETCEDCRERSEAYERQPSLLQSLSGERPPAIVRETVLAQAASQDEVRRLQRFTGRRVGILVAATSFVLGAVAINTPAPRAIGEAIGVTSPLNGSVACGPKGYTVWGYKRIISSPEQFDPGPDGFNNVAYAQRVESKFVDPKLYVIDPGNFATTMCSHPLVFTTVEIGANPTTNEQLVMAGVPKNPDVPIT